MTVNIDADIIVVGGGHAGIEAVNIASKSGMNILIITANIDSIGQMSCNPAIGGIAKGIIVREIDALGGVMGRIIDKAGIQFRMLNKSKGTAVWGNRAQADKIKYREICRKWLEKIENINIYQDMVTGIIVNNSKVCGVITESGKKFFSHAVILAMGTFLNGLAHIGMNSFRCGRSGERSSDYLSESIQGYGIKAGRLKTGTPPRINGNTVDFSLLSKQNGDDDPWPFSFSTDEKIENSICCWETKTCKNTHNIIRNNIKNSPLFSGKIKGIGPRYCPSIEDKVIRFGDRSGHTLFLEPEGLNTNEMYLNGLSTSFSLEIQHKLLRSIPAFRSVKIVRPAYAIEYDFFFPEQLYKTLESRIVENLYFAGQINGTSGYEEAACQGLIAGINAVLKIQKKEEIVLGRDSSYIGVLIDDLVTKGTEEPYRMFTSRAEYRLLLRQDNADERLMPVAKEKKIIEESVYLKRKEVWERKKKIKNILSSTKINPEIWRITNNNSILKEKITTAELIKRPEITIFDALKVIDKKSLTNIKIDKKELIGLESDIKYSGFIKKQKKEIEKQKKVENTEIPYNFDYEGVNGLLRESRSKLKLIKPLTLGQASRISGITPADVSVLMLHIIKK